MGFDLTLLPVTQVDESWGFAHMLLPLDRDRDMFDRIDKLGAAPEPSFQLRSYLSRIKEGPSAGEQCYGMVTHDPYGAEICYAPSCELAKAMVGGNSTKWNEAAAAFLRDIPTMPVALYWH